MKNKWSNYGLKAGKIQESYIREYCNRSPRRQASEASNSNSLLQSREVQKEIRIQDENVGKENIVETHQQGFQRIQSSTEGRSTVEEENSCQTQGKEMKKEKESPKAHKKHEAKESKAYEKKEDKKEKSNKKK